jgi:hypothetical protein
MQQTLASQRNPLAGRAAWKPVALRGPFRIGQSVGEGLGVAGVVLPIISLGISGSIAYVGMNAALNQRGWLSALGWVTGISGFLGILFTIGGLFVMGSVPDKVAEEMDRSAQAAP